MEIYKCYVPRKQYAKAKDLSILIYNKDRRKHPEMSDFTYEKWLGKQIRERFEACNGMKPLVEILTEYYEEVKKESK